MIAHIEKDQCTGCGNCLAACPGGLLSLTGAEDVNRRGVRYAVLSDPSSCVECGQCELMCTAGAIRSGKEEGSGYALIRKEGIPPHGGCYLGTLTKVLADAAVHLGIEKDMVIFEKEASNINLDVETHSYNDDSFYADGLAYKAEHPEKLVILICASSKARSTAQFVERYAALRDETVTIVNTLNWFETTEILEGITAGGCHNLEELARTSSASFLARAGVRTPGEVRELARFVEKALRNQMAGKPFSVVEMLFPCLYRVGGRPRSLMPFEQVDRINAWFDACVAPDYEYKVYLDR